ncbi:MAG: DUF4282 domain-containing protein [Armatimonadota bacterium]
MWSCLRCYFENENDDTRYCGRCGAPRHAEEAAKTYHRELPPPPAGYFAFRKMISPLVIRLINLLGLLACTGAGSWFLYQAYRESFVDLQPLLWGILLILPANIVWRMACEILLLVFSMHEVLVSIETRLAVRE